VGCRCEPTCPGKTSRAHFPDRLPITPGTPE
jgi:hypothetical protein